MLKQSPHILHAQRNVRRKKIIKKNILNIPTELLEFSGSVSYKASSNTSNSSKNTKSPGLQSSKSITKRVIRQHSTTPGLKKIFSSLFDHLQDKIIDNVLPNKYLLRHWIPLDKIIIRHLCKNPNAISFLKDITDLPIEEYNALPEDKKIDWTMLSLNPNAMYLIYKKLIEENKLTEYEYNNLRDEERINWPNLCSNPNAIKILKLKIEEEKKLGQTAILQLDWKRRIDWTRLSENRNAGPLLKENEEKIEWYYLLRNKNLDIDLLKKLLSKIQAGEKFDNHHISWYSMSSIPNSKVINLLYSIFPDKIDYKALSMNKCSASINLLLANKKHINWPNLCSNTHPEAIKLLSNNLTLINWEILAINTNIEAIKLIDNMIAKKPRIVRLDNFCENLSKNPKAIKLLEKYPETVKIIQLCQNPNAVKLIRKNIDKIKTYHYPFLSSNPCIFIEK
jgi:hypothetical protein